MSELLASSVIVTPPEGFRANRETFASNAFQQRLHVENLQETVLQEHQGLVDALRKEGIEVLLLPIDPDQDLPDAVFLNNWFTTHADGRVVLYPMAAPSRRAERNDRLPELLRSSGYSISEIVDLSNLEDSDQFLEGTGSLVLDHKTGTAFACASSRTDPYLACAWADQFGYELVYFSALDRKGLPVYHTNVILTVGPECALIAADLIPDLEERYRVLERLRSGGRDIVQLSAAQVSGFAGNQLFLQGDSGPKLLLSQSADQSLSSRQKRTLDRHAERVAVNVHVLERLGGGSVRCMIAENFLPRLES